MLPDQKERLRAISDHASTLLVEAGAGTGKTSLLAARVALLFASGARPEEIAAITFTEVAASQLLERITEYVDELLGGRMPEVLEPAFPKGVMLTQLSYLERAALSLDQLTCTTIHGFCQRLIKPYPVEARLDPGAAVMDKAESDLAYSLLLRKWLRSQLESNGAPPLAELLLQEETAGESFIYALAQARRIHRDATAVPSLLPVSRIDDFRNAVAGFSAWHRQLTASGLEEPQTANWIEDFERLASVFEPGYSAETSFSTLWRYACPKRIPAMVQTSYRLTKRPGFKGRWETALRTVGQSRATASRYADEANRHYTRISETLAALLDDLSEIVLSQIITALDPLQGGYRSFKQQSALLDFDDLLYHARDLLRSNQEVRQALAGRYHYILVDEFQDTDPIQCEILLLLCGERSANAPWEDQRLRPGQLFLVGDPKQSIYRFRGADIDCYQRARQIVETQFPGNRVEITANFRSQAPILQYVNDRFADPLRDIGFAPLACTQARSDSGTPNVACVEVGQPDTTRSDERRLLEAAAIAELCGNLIGRLQVRGKDGVIACRPGDIALLAPSGTGLWMYERALEQKGIPIATQAGKGLFRRQEIHDLIAVTRVLSSSRDTLALGAVLRGPLVGLTEQELLDIIEQLPPGEGRDEAYGRLWLWTEPASIRNKLAAQTLSILQSLARQTYTTSPFNVLSMAVEELRVRPLLVQRHPRYAERALANVDVFLEMAKPYAVAGLRVFAREMSRLWAEGQQQVEGRSDSGADALQVITVHSAKGLEWPVVIATNMITEVGGASGILYRASDHSLHCTFGLLAPSSCSAIQQDESAQLARERLRLWYVLCTRARDLLVIPRHAWEGSKWWLQEIDLRLSDLPAFPKLVGDVPESPPAHITNRQTAAVFAEEARSIVRRTTEIEWTQPSRHEISEDELPIEEPMSDEVATSERPKIRGSTARGMVLHKLMEEVLNGEIADIAAELEQRADVLLAQAGTTGSADPAAGPCCAEMAETVLRTLHLPVVAAYRARLLPEWNVYYSEETGENHFKAAAGLADAVACNDAGQAELVVDWKSDVHPDAATQQLYAKQMLDYLSFLGCTRGALVYITSGLVQEVNLATAADV